MLHKDELGLWTGDGKGPLKLSDILIACDKFPSNQ